MTIQKPIETPRLLLKCMTPAIIWEAFSCQSKEEIMTAFGIDEEDFAVLKQRHDGGMETSSISFCYFLLIEKASNRSIGECGFHTLNRKHRRADAFYSLKNDSDKRKGLMSEAFGEVLKFGFTELGLHRVAALLAKENTASLKLLQKYHFTREGTMREDYVVDGKNEDSECYSLLRWEWEKTN